MAKNTICLWYDKDAEAAARFYAETFRIMISSLCLSMIFAQTRSAFVS
jgi:predicted 3-demethylubiquinone-9 3-methyltransferase (glyoxalase superfamily)